MTTSPVLTLPPDAAGTAGSAPAAARGKPAAWQREMEKALEQAWFEHPLILLCRDAADSAAGQASALPAATAFTAFAVGLLPPVAVHTVPAQSSPAGPVPSSLAAHSPALESAPAENVLSEAGVAGPSDGTAPSPAAVAASDSRPAQAVAQPQASAKTLPAAQAPGGAAALVTVAESSAECALPAGVAAPSDIAFAMQASASLPTAMLDQLVTQLVDWRAAMPQTAELAMPNGACIQLQAAMVAEPVLEGEEPAAGVGTRPQAEQAGEPMAPLRLHAEWSEQGVRIWLGADAQAGDSAPALAPQLVRWLAQQGVALLSLVCNGRTVYVASDTASDARQAGGRRADGVTALPRERGVAYQAHAALAPQAFTDQFF